jgi:hypothetical protein
VSGTLAEKVRNICLKLLSLRNAEPISTFEDGYLDANLQMSSGATRKGEKIFGYNIEDRPLNIDFCGFTGRDATHPLADGDVHLFRLGHSDDGSRDFQDAFYGFSNSGEGWSTAGYDQQMGSRSVIAIDAPLNYWFYDRKSRISELAVDFARYLELQKTPPGATLSELHSAYLDRSNVKPSPDTASKRVYFLGQLSADEQTWPREMFTYLEKEIFAPSAGFTVTYSQKFADAFVVTGKDTVFDADLYFLALRKENGAAFVRIRAPWVEGKNTASDQDHKTTSAIACSLSFGTAKLPCNR